MPSWKRRLLDSLASELARRGAARSRIGDGVAADSIDERIERLARELRARARDRTGYDRPAAVPTGVAVNQSA